MQEWPAERRLRYLVLLGIKNRKAEYTREFGGESDPDPESVAAIGSSAVVKLLYVLKHGDDICLNASTAQSLTRDPNIEKLIAIVETAVEANWAQRTAVTPRKLSDADRDSVVGLALTADGKEYVTRMLHLDAPAASVV